MQHIGVAGPANGLSRRNGPMVVPTGHDGERKFRVVRILRRLLRYFFQKAGVSSTSTLKISRRPRIIAAVQTQV